MGILYRYELKKIMSQKVIWIALLIMIAMIVAQGMSGLMTGNNKLLKKADAISGRAVNQELITELLEGNQLDDYPVMKNLWTQCIHKNDYTGLDEQTLYGSRLAVIDQEMDSYKLSDSEKEYWSRQDEKVQKPFIYQREDGYSAIFSTIYILNFLMLLLVGISVTGVFADEKSRGTDQLIFSSVNKQKIFITGTWQSFRCNGSHGSGDAFIHVKYTRKFQGDFTNLEIHAGCVYRFMDIYRLSADKGIWTLSEYLSDGTDCMGISCSNSVSDCKAGI